MTVGSHPGRVRRARNLVLVAVFAAAAVGYFVGLGGGTPRPDGTGGTLPAGSGAPPASGAAVPATSYAALPRALAERAAAGQAGWAERADGLRAPPAAVPVTDEESKLASLDLRAARRAYNGAPPVVPHAVAGLTDASCNACHAHGLAPGGDVARATPHAALSQCTQCHAPPQAAFLDAAPPQALTGEILARNDFRGAPAPRAGARAWPGAPPVVPHSTWMRENCLACHGPHGWPGLHTTHPERRSCLQCHGSSAVFEQVPVDSGVAAFLPPLQVLPR